MSRSRRGNGREKFRQTQAEDPGPEEDGIVVTDEHGNPVEEPSEDNIQVVEADSIAGTEPASEDDPYEVLQRQFEEIKAARETDAAKIREYEQRAASQQQDQFATQQALLEHAIQSSQTALRDAKKEFAQAMSSGDFDTAAEAQEAIAANQLEIRNYELAKDHLERQKAAPRPQAGDQVEAYISTFTPETQTWARRHKADLFSSQGRLATAFSGHYLATEKGYTPDTPEYFDYLDKHMGYADQPAKRQSTPRPAMVSAPVSRGAANGGSVEVSLTQKERDMASRLGMTLSRYAKYKKELEKNGKLGQYGNQPR
jgi:hypothetical protein